MQGLELAECYFYDIGLPMLKEKFPDYMDRIAAGLVGEGSDCFGFDDQLSRDHDWGPGFCIWLTKSDFEKIGEQLQNEYDQLPKSYNGYPPRYNTALGGKRVGVFEIGAFYAQFIGVCHTPQSYVEWRRIPEYFLATVTDGKVFMDTLGEFSDFRNTLLSYYPEDIRLKKMSARCSEIAQSGQYNYLRCMEHNEYVAASYALSQFIHSAISLTFLLNRKYMPFYKWMHRSLKNLPILGGLLYPLFSQLAFTRERSSNEISSLIEKICGHLIKELYSQKLSDAQSDFLLDHAPVIQSKINNDMLRSLHIMAE